MAVVKNVPPLSVIAAVPASRSLAATESEFSSLTNCGPSVAALLLAVRVFTLVVSGLPLAPTPPEPVVMARSSAVISVVALPEMTPPSGLVPMVTSPLVETDAIVTSSKAVNERLPLDEFACVPADMVMSPLVAMYTTVPAAAAETVPLLCKISSPPLRLILPLPPVAETFAPTIRSPMTADAWTSTNTSTFPECEWE